MEDSQKTTVHQVWSSFSCVGLWKLALREADILIFFPLKMVQNEHQAEEELFNLKESTKPNEWLLWICLDWELEGSL